MNDEISISFHQVGGVSSSAVELTVEKASSKTTRYCGEMLPVCKFKIRGTSLVWTLLNPTKTPRLDRGCQRGSFLPDCRVGSRTYTGHPHVCISRRRCRGS